MTSTSLPRFDSRQATRARIMDVAMRRGSDGCTADELASAWGCSHNHVAPRLSELKASGWLIPTERTRPTRTGATARVLIAAKFAHQEKDPPVPAEDYQLFPDDVPPRHLDLG